MDALSGKLGSYRHSLLFDRKTDLLFSNRLTTACSGVSKFLTAPHIKNGIIGEDAFFTQSQVNCDVLGVADGVGGWSSIGIDPSIFSSNLMNQCKRIVDKDVLKLFKKNSALNISTPVKLLDEAYRTMTSSHDDSLIGSATACILCFDYTTNNLLSANLGDSGFVVIPFFCCCVC